MRSWIITQLCSPVDNGKLEDRLVHLYPVATSIPKAELQGHSPLVKEFLMLTLGVLGNGAHPQQSDPRRVYRNFAKMFVLLVKSGINCEDLSESATRIVPYLRMYHTQENDEICDSIIQLTENRFGP